MGTSFFDTKVVMGRLENCDLKDCLLFDTASNFKKIGCTENLITKPIVGILWNIEKPGHSVPLAYRSLKEFNSLPIRINYRMDSIDTKQLDLEMCILVEL